MPLSLWDPRPNKIFNIKDVEQVGVHTYTLQNDYIS